ncbi:hypothetical protein SAMN02982996_01172 [Lonsdalea quercina]|uniref:Uncharacterized protein n=1 Tax=Lonsdalea quercina TaxID=71657 RepID=A0A1H3ZGT0_9GAMM|nr:hypothetical protein SAMN02982996_01172 [Lonsdalea quercina]
MRDRSFLVIFLPQAFDFFLRIFQWQELVNVQTLVPKTAVKRLYQRVICWFAGPRDVHRHIISYTH